MFAVADTDPCQYSLVFTPSLIVQFCLSYSSFPTVNISKVNKELFQLLFTVLLFKTLEVQASVILAGAGLAPVHFLSKPILENHQNCEAQEAGKNGDDQFLIHSSGYRQGESSASVTT